LINLNLMRMVCDSTYIVDQETGHDTKTGELISILEESLTGNENKAVVFSQGERMTRLVARELDEQRIGKVHRYGQKNKVSVINFVSAGAIKHRIGYRAGKGRIDRGRNNFFNFGSTGNGGGISHSGR